MYLFLNYYIDKNPQRQKELDKCLELNLLNEFIEKVVCIATDMPHKHHKLEIVNEPRPTYFRMFEIANESGAEVSCIANTDIYFDHTLSNLKTKLKRNQCFALSRWDIDQYGEVSLRNRADSQDVWIFRGRIKPVYDSRFNMGVAGCDNRIAYSIRNSGYKIINCPFLIKAYHLHLSNQRNYLGTAKIPEPYYFPKPMVI